MASAAGPKFAQSILKELSLVSDLVTKVQNQLSKRSFSHLTVHGKLIHVLFYLSFIHWINLLLFRASHNCGKPNWSNPFINYGSQKWIWENAVNEGASYWALERPRYPFLWSMHLTSRFHILVRWDHEKWGQHIFQRLT